MMLRSKRKLTKMTLFAFFERTVDSVDLQTDSKIHKIYYFQYSPFMQISSHLAYNFMYIQRLSQNIVEFLDICLLRHLPEFSSSWSCRAFQEESKERMNASV